MKINKKNSFILGGTLLFTGVVSGATLIMKHLHHKKEQELITIEEKKVLPMTHKTLEELSLLSDETLNVVTEFSNTKFKVITSELKDILERFVTTPTIELNPSFISFIFQGKNHQYYLTFYEENYTLTMDGIGNSYESQYYPYTASDLDGESVLQNVNSFIKKGETD